MMRDHARAAFCASFRDLGRTSVSCPGRRTVRIAAILLAALGLVACGDDDQPVRGDATVIDARPVTDASRDVAVDAAGDATVDRGGGGPDAGVDGSGDAGDGATGDGGDGGPAVDGGDSGDSGAVTAAVWPGDATKMVAEDRGGGFAPAPPAGSQCQGGATYTMTVADKLLVWSLCQATMPGVQPYQIVTGQRTLTGPEMDMLTALLGNVTLSTQPSCGADKQTLALKVTSPRGEREYLDDFYSCLHQGIYVAGLDALFQFLRTTAK
jgi:hypothetical protein